MILYEFDFDTLDDWFEKLPDIFSSILDLFFLFLSNILSFVIEKFFSLLTSISGKFSTIGKLFVSVLDSFSFDYTNLSVDFLYFFFGLIIFIFVFKLIWNFICSLF